MDVASRFRILRSTKSEAEMEIAGTFKIFVLIEADLSMKMKPSY